MTVRYQPVQAGSHEKMVVFTLGSRSLGRVVSGRSASQTGGTGTIEGTVEIPVMATTKKVPNARIEINRVDGLESLSIGRGGRTDSQGCFSVARLPSGTYKVVASPPQKYYKSYERAVITVNVTADATVTADLTLPQKTPPPVVSAKDMPIVLVRGRGKYGVNEAEYWSEVKTYLDNEGFSCVWDPNETSPYIINGEAGIFANATSLSAYIQDKAIEYRVEKGFKPPGIRIIAHSMGGLIVRQYIHQFYNKTYDNLELPPVQDVIMLGAPHAGSLLADYRMIFGKYDRAWQSNKDLLTTFMHEWHVSWPSDKDLNLYQVGGTSGGFSGRLFWGARSLALFGLPGDTDSDGAVTVLSSRGQYIREWSLLGDSLKMFLGNPVLFRRYSLENCFNPPENGIGHQLRAVNHNRLKTDSSILRWISHIMAGGQPKSISELNNEKRRVLVMNEPPPMPLGGTVPGGTDIIADKLVYYEVGEVMATQAVSRIVNIDPTQKGQIIISCSSTTLWVNVESPSSNTFDRVSSAGVSNVTFECTASSNAALCIITLDDPEAGEWSVGLDSEEDAKFTIYASVASEITFGVSQLDEAGGGSDVLLLAAVVAGSSNLPVTTISAGLMSPSGVTSNITLYDDGGHGDNEAGDRIFGATLSDIGEVGAWQLVYHATGLHPSGTGRYERVKIRTLSIADTGGFIVEVDGYESIDTDDNGFADFVRVDILVSISSPGEYTIAGTMIVDDEENVPISAATDFTVVSNCNAIVSLLFNSHDLPQGAIYGPFLLGDIRLNRVSDQLIWLDTLKGGEQFNVIMYNKISRYLRVVGEFDFGGVRVGTQKISQVSLHNDGWKKLTVGGIALPTGFTGGFSGKIEPDEEVVVPITFTPFAETSYTGLFEVVSDAVAGDDALPLVGFGMPEAVSYTQWATDMNLPSGMTSPTNVVNQDGVPNYLAYIHNIDPVNGVVAGDTNALPFWHLCLSNQFLAVDYRINQHAVGFSFDVEFATNLMSETPWREINSDEIEKMGVDPMTGDPRFRIKRGFGESGRGFMRVNVTLDDPD